MGLQWPVDSKDFGKSVSIKSGIIELPGFFFGGGYENNAHHIGHFEKENIPKQVVPEVWVGVINIEMSIVNPSKMD